MMPTSTAPAVCRRIAYKGGGDSLWFCGGPRGDSEVGRQRCRRQITFIPEDAIASTGRRPKASAASRSVTSALQTRRAGLLQIADLSEASLGAGTGA